MDIRKTDRVAEAIDLHGIMVLGRIVFGKRIVVGWGVAVDHRVIDKSSLIEAKPCFQRQINAILTIG